MIKHKITLVFSLFICLGIRCIDNLQRGLYSNAYAQQKLNELRGIMLQAQITIYDYFVLGKIASITDPRGFTTYFSYDTAWRLNESYYKESNGSQKLFHMYILRT